MGKTSDVTTQNDKLATLLQSPTNMQRLRKMTGLLQRQFADRIGYSKTAVTSWETGRYAPAPAAVAAIVDTFKLRLVDAVSGLVEIEGAEGKVVFSLPILDL